MLWCGVDPSGAACLSGSASTQALTIPGNLFFNRGGPPTIADFDGDGRPEIGVAGADFYTVIDINRSGEEIVQPAGSALPGDGQLFVRWKVAVQDGSSNASGSSVFDFQGDGAAEVVYTDECHMWVFSGTDGSVELEIENSSGTIHEYPLVVDIDNDQAAELLIVAKRPPAGSIAERTTPREKDCMSTVTRARVGLRREKFGLSTLITSQTQTILGTSLSLKRTVG